MARAPMGGGGPAKNIKVDETLLGFKKRVDGILQNLESSAASKTHMADQTVSRAAFGGAFNEADDLYGQYNQVHQLLTDLSRTLNDQIEATGIAALAADNDFEGIDQDVLHRFWQIQTGAQNRYQEQQWEQQQRRQEETERLGGKPGGPGNDGETEGF
ncbi:hypothetical protein [Streptomyces sp. JJ36]|uniref:hypothetical protein n=1 Tax=Streptomyces sp. JJ36 TaxID=2736645 RepID=UPI001F336D48|nr:hypothetical protein [Streptomyces sp. JJ36]MCF6524912.1 hypothetical protein [Streptomyces sp. JJ36]